ncbi:50S ribosomal protein L24 [Guggenheimella bovis]
MKIKKGDKVIVIAGEHKGDTGEVVRVFPRENRVIVQGVNMVKKHQKPNMRNNTGGIITQEAPIHISNVMYLDKTEKKRTRVGHDVLADGRKVRVSKLTKETLE